MPCCLKSIEWKLQDMLSYVAGSKTQNFNEITCLLKTALRMLILAIMSTRSRGKVSPVLKASHFHIECEKGPHRREFTIGNLSWHEHIWLIPQLELMIYRSHGDNFTMCSKGMSYHLLIWSWTILTAAWTSSCG